MITVGSKRLISLLFFASMTASATPAQFHAKSFDGFDVLSCSDMTAVPEAMDYMRHDPNNPALLGLMQEGNCSPMSPEVSFTIVKKYTWQVAAGPQDLVQIAMPVAENPQMPPFFLWMLASDIEPVH